MGELDGHLAVEVGGAQQKLRRRAVSQVGNGRRDDVAAPAILERHDHAERHAQIAGLFRLGQPAELADLDVHHIHRSIGMTTHEHIDAVEDVWVQVYADTAHGDPLRAFAESLTDVAEQFSDWRYRHLMAVRRAMGAKVGSGGSAGLAWLERSLLRQAFPELWSARTRI